MELLLAGMRPEHAVHHQHDRDPERIARDPRHGSLEGALGLRRVAEGEQHQGEPAEQPGIGVPRSLLDVDDRAGQQRHGGYHQCALLHEQVQNQEPDD